VVKQEEIDQLLKSGAEDFVHKPFTITKEAGATRAGLHAIERKYSGNDHTLLGKQLTQRWRLPEPINPAIWLHRSDVAAFAHTISTVTKPGSCLCYRADRSSGSLRSS
jgi:HD-like signal output (HDOD) protein